jgi:hypothetical protein
MDESKKLEAWGRKAESLWNPAITGPVMPIFEHEGTQKGLHSIHILLVHSLIPNFERCMFFFWIIQLTVSRDWRVDAGMRQQRQIIHV